MQTIEIGEYADHTFTVRLDPEELAALQRLSEEKKMTPGQLLRLALNTYGIINHYRSNTKEPMPWERHRFDEPFGAGLAE